MEKLSGPFEVPLIQTWFLYYFCEVEGVIVIMEELHLIMVELFSAILDSSQRDLFVQVYASFPKATAVRKETFNLVNRFLSWANYVVGTILGVSDIKMNERDWVHQCGNG